MTLPDRIVEIGFTGPSTGTYLHLDDPVRGRLDTGTLAPTDLWTDVSEFVVSVSTRRGASRTDGPVLRYEGGTATIVLRNEDRRFDPTNLDGPYVAGGVTQVEPMRAVRVRARWDGVTYPVWRGYADDWQVSYEGPNASTVTLTCIDAFAIFEANEREASVSAGAGEDSGARIDRILDSVNWPDADRIIATGDSTLQATTLEGSALAELQLTADSELGEFYMGSAGHAVFRNRLALYEEIRSLRPNAVFGDSVESGDTTVNLITNPSAEIDLTGWAAGGSVPPTLSRDSTRAWVGTYSVLATWATATPVTLTLVQYTIVGLTVGKTYTASVYVYVPSGSPGVALLTPTTGGQWGTASFGLFDQWVRLTLTFTAVSSTLLFQVWPENSTTTAGQQVWLDALQCEEGGSATDYVDGSLTTTEASDDFARTASSSWGTSTTGQAWTVSGGSTADYSVSGGAGKMALTTVNVSRRATLDVSEQDVIVAATVSVDAVATGAAIRVGIPMRIVDAATDHTRVQVNFDLAGALSLSVVRRVGGGDSTVATASLPDTYTAGTQVHVIAQVAGDTWRAMAWTTSAPLTWSISATDSTHTAAGPVGVRSVLAIGNTNGTVNVSIDNFVVSVDDPMTEWDGTEHASTSRRLPELPYADIQVGYDAQSIRNRISITRVGGTVQTVEDTASQTAYLTRTYPRSDILLETDGAALDYAGALLHQARTPELRVTQLELKPRRDERLWPQVLGREIGDRVKAIRRPPGGGDPISREVFVRGIEHQFTAEMTWATRWVFQSGTRGQFLILNNPTLGQLDNNALGY